MSYKLVIVESPAKAKTITKYLPEGCVVQATMGHIIDLPKKGLGIDIENNFEPEYETITGKAKTLSEIKKSAKGADEILLATDPDREGEAISYHLANSLKLNLNDSNRIEFHEITPRAIENAVKNKRPVNMDLVNAQQARRVLDRLVGYKISPILWKKIMKGLSAGRVQSVATRLIVEREREIEEFVPQEYWHIDATFIDTKTNEEFFARLNSIDGEKAEILNAQEADNILSDLEKGKYFVCDIKEGSRKKSSPLPFTTSTLQQEAFRKIGFSTKRTMMNAQALYEGIEIKGKGHVGLITYLRTDSTRISQEAQEQVSEYITKEFGKEYLGSAVKKKKTAVKAQDAHEAIRPTDINITPESIKTSLTNDQYRLYQLIYNRFLAAFMAPAVFDTLRVDINNNQYIFRATGERMKFPGFLKIYETENSGEDVPNNIPSLEIGEGVEKKSVEGKQKFTMPPARYSEASLVKTLEEKGIGRPSTYAPTISTIQNRGYVILEEKKFKPTDLGKAANELMERNFSDIVDYDFTAQMEEYLDKIADGKEDWHKIIKEFFSELSEDLEKASDSERIKLPEVETEEVCEKCGRKMVIKTGRFGKFLACPGFPECSNTKPLIEKLDVACPKCGGAVVQRKSKKGRTFFGCTNYPKCDFVSWNKPTNETCPNCSKMLFEKSYRGNVSLVCEDKDCGYTSKKDGN